MFFTKKRVMPVLFLSMLPALGQAAELESLDDRFSYALGYQFGAQLKAQGVRVNGAAFGAALDDLQQDKALVLSFDEMRQAVDQMKEKLVKEKEESALLAQAKSEQYLSDNSSKEGVKTLPSGLQYKILTAGEGEVPAAGSTVTVNYRGTLIDGKEFDSSYARNEPAEFSLNGVIPGFKEGLSLMNKGAKWMLYIPSKLGYGPMGAPGSIGPNETLIFEVELISFAVPVAAAPTAEMPNEEMPKEEK